MEKQIIELENGEPISQEAVPIEERQLATTMDCLSTQEQGSTTKKTAYFWAKPSFVCFLIALTIFVLFFEQTSPSLAQLRRQLEGLESSPWPTSVLPAAQLLRTAPNRFSPLDVSRQVNFVHISKCAGSSWIHQLKRLLRNFYPLAECGLEHSIPWQRSNHPANYTFTSIKSPRHHVWSLFTGCKYDKYYVDLSANTGFPRRGNTAKDDMADFEEWLDHFVTVNTDSEAPQGIEELDWNNNDYKNYYQVDESVMDHYQCYHPSNYMGRAFVFDDYDPHGVSSIDQSRKDRYEPTLEVALDTYWSLDWVSVAELYVESQCLLYYRFWLGEEEKSAMIRFDNNTNGVQYLTHEFVETHCHCPQPKPHAKVSSHIIHHKEGKRSSMRHGVPPAILKKIDALTRSTDVPLYKVALIQLLHEIQWLEDQLGHRVLCDSKLEHLTFELEYLGLGNLTYLYLERSLPPALNQQPLASTSSHHR